MNRNFLVFSVLVSCLIVFVSFVYYIYTGYRLNIQYGNEQGMSTEFESPFIGNPDASASFQPSTPQHANAVPMVSERNVTKREAFENLFENTKLEETEVTLNRDDFDKVDGYVEVEEKTSNAHGNLELEELFKDMKQIHDERDVILRNLATFSIELRSLKYRQMEIGMQDLVHARGDEIERLHEEFHRSGARLGELRTIIAPIEKQDFRLQQEAVQKVSEYGMTIEEFYEKYEDLYKSWKSKR